ncbi:MAG: DUF4344 domain-containing metallopeptidase [Rhizomicrobium sp.]
MKLLTPCSERGTPNFDNEDDADQFATVLLTFIGKENIALQAAQWCASQDSRGEARQALLTNDRHSLSIQRARNILNWLSRKNELERRWLHVLIPNMTDGFLGYLVGRAATYSKADADSIAISQQLKDELKRRHG